jgi:hypothetical protein
VIPVRTVAPTHIVPDFPAYNTVSEEEKEDAWNAYHNGKKDNNKLAGYQSTNPFDKNKINGWVSSAINNSKSLFGLGSTESSLNKIIILDHTEFGTATALVSAGVCSVEQLIIPQNQTSVYNQMVLHSEFGCCVRLSTLEDVLQECADSRIPISAVYADLTCAFSNAIKVLNLISKVNLTRGAIVGVTIALRDQESVDYTHQKAYKLVTEMYKRFRIQSNIVEECTESGNEVYVYGGGTTMAISIMRILYIPI